VVEDVADGVEARLSCEVEQDPARDLALLLRQGADRGLDARTRAASRSPVLLVTADEFGSLAKRLLLGADAEAVRTQVMLRLAEEPQRAHIAEGL
jgi:hypothetical protein